MSEHWLPCGADGRAVYGHVITKFSGMGRFTYPRCSAGALRTPELRYKRIPIETKYPDGKKGAIVIETPFLFSFGVNEKNSQETDKLVGYSIPVCLWGRDSVPSEAEREFYDSTCKFTYVCKQHLEEEYGADMASSMSDPFYYKKKEYVDKKGKKKTKIDGSAAPLLYVKLINSDKTKKILSLFKTKGNKIVNPFKYINQYCYVKMALIVEGIYVSKNVTSFQIKDHEVYIKPLKPRESLLKVEESDDEGNESEDVNIEDLIISDKEVEEWLLPKIEKYLNIFIN